jgi:hypothetical protein
MSGAVDSPSTAASSVRSVSSATTFSEAADDNGGSGSSESDPFSDDESSNPDIDAYDGTDTASIVSHSAAVVGLTGPPYVSFATDLLADYEVSNSKLDTC